LVDLQSQVKAPLVQAPTSWVARELLASAPSVQAVMVLGDDGKVLAHERAVGYEGDVAPERERSLTYYSPRFGLIFYIRTNGNPADGDLSGRIEAIIESPAPPITR
jgi:hypothetical protein